MYEDGKTENVEAGEVCLKELATYIYRSFAVLVDTLLDQGQVGSNVFETRVRERAGILQVRLQQSSINSIEIRRNCGSILCMFFFPLKLFFLQVRGVHVQVEISDSSSIITFMPYFVGSSPVRLENRLQEDIPVTVFQRLDRACHVVFRPNIGAQRRRKRRRLRQQRDQSNVYLVESERKARFLLEISFIFRASILQ